MQRRGLALIGFLQRSVEVLGVTLCQFNDGIHSDLLEEAGVDTVVELAQRNPENLYAALKEANERKRLVRRLPTLEQVKDWVQQAKQLPRVLTY